MTDEVLVTGLVHLALIAALAALPQQVLLAPTRLQRGAMGLACGLASVLVALQGLPAYAEGVRHMHPTLVASAAFLLGPCAGVLAAAASLGSQWLADTPDWSTGLGLACATTALGLAWRLARQRGHLAVWPSRCLRRCCRGSTPTPAWRPRWATCCCTPRPGAT
jgi:hypothetical protein